MDAPTPPHGICHIKAPTVPQFRFEYHPGKRSVYVIDRRGTPEIGELIAPNIPDAGTAQNAVSLWLRGYRRAMGERWNDGGKLIERPDRPVIERP